MPRNRSEKLTHRKEMLAYAAACDQYLAGEYVDMSPFWNALSPHLRDVLRDIASMYTDSHVVKRRKRLAYIRKTYGA